MGATTNHRMLLENAHASARAACEERAFRLGMSVTGQKGGRLLTKLAGSSLEFHEHRSYYPGDDPRFIDWHAAARTGNHFVKVFRDELLPIVDVFVDLSTSMFLPEEKARRSCELMYWILELARQEAAACKFWGLSPHAPPQGPPQAPPRAPGGAQQSVAGVTLLSTEEFLSYSIPIPDPLLIDQARSIADRPSITELFGHARARKGSLKILISDLLNPADPRELLSALTPNGIILTPWCREERYPEWAGNQTFIDAETGSRRKQLVSPTILRKYRETYERHFEMWRGEAARYGVGLAYISSDGTLSEALHADELGGPSHSLTESAAITFKGRQ